MPPRWDKVATGILRSGVRGSREAVVQWQSGGGRSALPVVKGTLEVVARLGGCGTGLG